MPDDRYSGSLPLLPSVWRDLLAGELVGVGVEQDVAALVARRVIERLVRAYLSDRLPHTTKSLDEAA